MREPRVEEQLRGHEARVEAGCPACDGPLAVRFSAAEAWAWCGACRRLSRALLTNGPEGPVLVHPTPAA
jgi:hypothetical protein